MAYGFCQHWLSDWKPQPMDRLTFISKIIGDVAWPLTLLTVVLIMRKQLQAAIGFVSKVKVSGVEVEFDRQLAAAKIEAAELPKSQPSLEHGAQVVTEEAIVLAKSSPRAAVLDAWRLVEIAALDSAKRLLGDEKFTNATMTFRAIQLLEKHPTVPPAAVSLLKNLRALRNEAAHAPHFDVSPASAVEYAHLAAQLIATLNALPDGASDRLIKNR
jgi:hypothetical protein